MVRLFGMLFAVLIAYYTSQAILLLEHEYERQVQETS